MDILLLFDEGIEKTEKKGENIQKEEEEKKIGKKKNKKKKPGTAGNQIRKF